MDEAAAGPCVLAEDHGPVRMLTLNRPGRRNAIDLELRVVLAEAIEGAMADEAVRAVVLTGAGGPPLALAGTRPCWRAGRPTRVRPWGGRWTWR